MTRRQKTTIGTAGLVLAMVIGGITWWNSREANVIVPITAAPAELVKFTATKAYANLPLEEQVKYLHAWGDLTDKQRADAIASLMGDQQMLQLSTMQTSEVLRLAQARAYFALKDKAARNKYLDQQIDAEQEMIKKGQAMVKNAEAQSGQKVAKGISAGDPLVRKYLLENSIPANRLETNAFTNELIQRMHERGLQT